MYTDGCKIYLACIHTSCVYISVMIEITNIMYWWSWCTYGRLRRYMNLLHSNGTPGTRKHPFTQCVSMRVMVPGAAKSCPIKMENKFTKIGRHTEKTQKAWKCFVIIVILLNFKNLFTIGAEIQLLVLKSHRSFAKLDLEPHWEKQLYLDPLKMKANSQHCFRSYRYQVPVGVGWVLWSRSRPEPVFLAGAGAGEKAPDLAPGCCCLA